MILSMSSRAGSDQLIHGLIDASFEGRTDDEKQSIIPTRKILDIKFDRLIAIQDEASEVIDGSLGQKFGS